MLISEKMQATHFSPAEQHVITYILQLQEGIENKTIKEITQETFTHPSTLIRIAKKMGFTGWSELKDAFLREVNYLNSHFKEIDANKPFQESDGIMTIANKLAVLERTTIDDTLTLLHHDELQHAQQLLVRANHIKVFASNANTLIAQDFVLKMRRIHKEVSISTTMGENLYEAFNCPSDTCSIIISYTGENGVIRHTLRALKSQQIPVIAITSIGNNSLADGADCTLRITTREKLYSKIASFSINTSVCYLLDLLYACVFADSYQENYRHLKSVGRIVDNRKSNLEIMRENE